MKDHNFTKRNWMLFGAASILVAAHLLGFGYLVSHVRLSSTVLVGALLLVVIKHLGLFAPLYALFRRRTRD